MISLTAINRLDRCFAHEVRIVSTVAHHRVLVHVPFMLLGELVLRAYIEPLRGSHGFSCSQNH